MHTRSLELGSRALSFETGKLAKQADGSVLVRMGDTIVLVSACHSAQPRQGIDFLPLTVDYREFTYASGRIPGGFFKREGKLTEKEVLTSRLIDRPIRPLFPSGWAYDTQVIALVVSADTDYDSDVLAVTGAGAALALAEIPFQKTVAGVRVGYVDGAYVINPTFAQRRASSLDLIIAGSADAIMMVEAGSQEVSEETMVGALDAGHTAIKQIVATIDDLAKAAGRKKLVLPSKDVDADFAREIEARAYGPLADAMRIKDKLENYSSVDKALEDLLASIPEDEADRRADAKKVFKGLKEKVMRDEALERGKRLDGRAFDEIRPIWTEVSVLPRVHGSAVFTRGETQALVSTTLGTADDKQRIETIEGESHKRFMLHYNFPPFSVGETGRFTGPGRREIGHGALAERALAPVVPAEADFPYVVRVVSDILESNGSSSMASVCGGAMSMMDAGVPLRAPVAGVAMGLIMDETTGKYAVLTDIAGAEDHYGDMDFRSPARVRHHRPPDGHQGRRHHDGDHASGTRAGARRPAVHPRQDGRDDRRAASADLAVCAAHRQHPHPRGQDPRRDRTRRQDDPQHHRSHGREDRRRRRWPHQRGEQRRVVCRARARHHPGAHGHARGR